jgi:phage N-6-adenine-methyltransferase
MNQSLLSSKDMTWGTPIEFFKTLDAEFNFTLDPCAAPDTAKCEKYYTKEDDGLTKDWSGEVVFCNPPYGRELPKWVEKCYTEWKKGTTVVMLIPSRTDTRYFHDYILDQAEVRFIKGRLKFQGAKDPAPFPSMVVVYKGTTEDDYYKRNSIFPGSGVGIQKF